MRRKTMSINIKVISEQSKGVDIIGSLEVYLEEKNNEKEALKHIEQLNKYYSNGKGTLFILLLRKIESQKSLSDLTTSLAKVFTSGYIIALRKSIYEAKILHCNLNEVTISFKY